MAKPGIGPLLRSWRQTRQLSQLALAVQAATTPRHVSFVETGRASPSREMVLRLAGVLDVPLRERNTLLLAAGFAPLYAESALEAPELGVVKRALDAILLQQEPFPAVVMNRRWDVLATNRAAAVFFGFLLDGRAAGPANVLRMMLDPALVRPFVVNWPEVAHALLVRVQREAVGGVVDAQLVAELRAYPGVPEVSPTASALPIVPVSFAKAGLRFDYFSTVTTLGTPQDVTAQETRVECFFPVDDATATAARALVD